MQQAPTIRKSLLRWFREEARDLPWRKSRDPYHIWLSEVLLQQTRVDQGLPYYERFLKALPTLPDLAAASEDDVLKLWEGLGYYTRARNLHKAARQIMEQHDGRLPDRVEVLQLLPGVGRYTAGAIASIAFGEQVPVVDGNVKRVLTRLFNIAQPIEDSATEKKLWAIADSLVPANDPGDFNQGMMELGARICTPKKPDCGSCPIQSECGAYKRNIQEKRPVRRPKKAVPHKDIVVAVILRDGKYLIGKRGTEGMLAGLWEFPGGKMEAGETHEEALRRECEEELGVEVKVGGMIASVRHAYTHLKVTLGVYRCTILSGKPKSKVHTELKWIGPDEFDDYAFPKANHKFIDLLRTPV